MKKLSLILILLLSTPVFAEDPIFIMKAGADFRATVYWQDSDKRPIDLTGNTYKSQFRATPGGTLFATYSTTVIGPGIMLITLSKEQTSRLNGKRGVWDVRQVDQNGYTTYEFNGQGQVNTTVTR